MTQKKINIELKGLNMDLLIYFEILCNKRKSSIRQEIITMMKQKVDEAMNQGILTKEEKDNYQFEIEEY